MRETAFLEFESINTSLRAYKFARKQEAQGRIAESMQNTAHEWETDPVYCPPSHALEALDVDDICSLLAKIGLSSIEQIVRDNNLTGNVLAAGVSDVKDLTELGMKMVHARVLFKHVNQWNTTGVLDFQPTLKETKSPVVAFAKPVEETYGFEAIEKDYARAMLNDLPATIRLINAADSGNRRAQPYVHLLYEDGTQYLKRNTHKSVEYGKMCLDWLRTEKDKASLADAPYMYNCYGCMLDNGRVVTQDVHEALKHYKFAADRGHTHGMRNVAYCYAWAIGVPQNLPYAASVLKRAADLGNPFAQWEYGECLFKGIGVEQNYKEAAKYFLLSAEHGNEKAQVGYGRCLLEGKGVREDEEKAFQYFQLAAAQESAEGQYWVGYCYAKGAGVPCDASKALVCYEKAAAQGHAEALFALGEILEFTFHNKTQAARCYYLAASNGHAAAQYNTALFFQRTNDTGFAVHSLENAARQGNADALYLLGEWYLYGICGLTRSADNARKMFQKAERRGHKLATQALAQLEKSV